MKIRFGTWNVNGLRRPTSQIDFLRLVDCDVVALQEVRGPWFDALAASGVFSWSASSLAMRPPLPGEGHGRRLGCAILGRHPFELRSVHLIDAAPLPERTLVCDIGCGDERLTVAGVHMPPGVTWKQLKPQTFIAVADWLAAHFGPTLLGMDANSPKVDHPDICRNEWFWPDEGSSLERIPPTRS